MTKKMDLSEQGPLSSCIILPGDTDDTVVLKSSRDGRHECRVELIEMIRIDALVMERLSSSPRIVDSYGHCACSVLTEDMYEEIELKIKEGGRGLCNGRTDCRLGIQRRCTT
jgi:hypothetical protein